MTETGDFTFAWTGAKLGTKVHCQVVSDMEIDSTHAISVVTDEASLLLEDPADFEWKANAKGLWSDAANWTCKANDGLPRVGYPTWGSQFNIYDNQTDVIEVDANYQDLRSGSTLGWGGADITFVGTVDDAEIGYPEGAGFKDDQYSNVKVTLDNVKLTVGSYHVWDDASLVLTNGAYLSTRWEFHVEGSRARVDVRRAVNSTRSVSMATASASAARGRRCASTMRRCGRTCSRLRATVRRTRGARMASSSAA